MTLLQRVFLTSLGLFLVLTQPSLAQQVTGSLKKWQPVTIDFTGPQTAETATNPNPFLDYRFNLQLTAPSGTQHMVPGYYAGDGRGGTSGALWRVKFVPDEVGTWNFVASFRQGANLAISSDAGAGSPAGFNATTGTMTITTADPQAPGNWRKGLLQYVGKHHYQFQNGEYFLKNGINSPENFFAFKGFDNTNDANGSFVHEYAAHKQHWRTGNPTFGANPELSKNIIGAINYLSDQGINAIYTMLMNIGGDGGDTYPYISTANTVDAKSHFDVSKLDQWQVVMEYAQSKGMLLHLVLSEAEASNANWLDLGGFGVERKLLFRELLARYGYLPAVQWNLREENTWASTLVQEMAVYLQSLSSRGDLIGIHNPVGAGLNSFDFQFHWMYGNPLFSFASVQFYEADMKESLKRAVERSSSAGRPWMVGMDEPDQPSSEDNAEARRKDLMYYVYMNKGQLEWYQGLDQDTRAEDFTDEEPLWRFSRLANQAFVSSGLPYWQMIDADSLIENGGGEVLADPGRDYLLWYRNLRTLGRLNLSGVAGTFKVRWYNPRTGVWSAYQETFPGGVATNVPNPPDNQNRDEDWLAHVHRTDIPQPSPSPTLAPSGSLVNPSFESGTSGWERSGDILGADFFAVDCNRWGGCRHGANYLKVTVADDGSAPYDPYVASAFFEAGANLSGRKYELAFDIKSHAGEHLVKGISIQRFPRWESASPWAGATVYVPDVTATTEWQRKTYTLVFPRSAIGNQSSQVRAVLRGIDDRTSTPVYYDNVVLIDKGETLIGDLTGDGVVNFEDYTKALRAYSMYGLFELNRVIQKLVQ